MKRGCSLPTCKKQAVTILYATSGPAKEKPWAFKFCSDHAEQYRALGYRTERMAA